MGPVDVQTVDEWLDVLEAAFQSPMWKELGEQDRRRYVILRDIGDGE
jgi:hypothetical protein